MIKALILILVVICEACVEGRVEECVDNAYPPPASHKVPVYKIDLDLPPQQRWTQLGQEKKKEIVDILDTFKKGIKAFGKAGQYLIDLVDDDMGKLVESLPEPFGDEIRGLSAASGLPLGEATLYNIFYEVFTWCTSIVAEDAKGTIYHGRNLDFGLLLGWDYKEHAWAITKALRPALVELHFMKQGNVTFKTVSFAGYIGVITGVKPGVFSFSLNEKFNLTDGGYMGIVEWIFGQREAMWVSFLGRQVLETAKSYDEAVKRLSTPKLIAPVYFIVGGISSGQGAVITRERTDLRDIWTMEKADKWFVLQTNYDHWKKPLFIDDRRNPGKACMKKKGQKNMTLPVLFNVLSSRPVNNKLTAYTALMSAKTGHLEVYLQYCPDPCWPW